MKALRWLLLATAASVACTAEPAPFLDRVRAALPKSPAGVLQLSGGHSTLCSLEEPFAWRAATAACLSSADPDHIVRLGEIEEAVVLSTASDPIRENVWAVALLETAFGADQPGRLEAAAALLRRLIADGTTTPELLNDFGVVLALHAHATGTPDEWLAALDAFEGALAARPAFEEAVQNRGAVLDRLGIRLQLQTTGPLGHGSSRSPANSILQGIGTDNPSDSGGPADGGLDPARALLEEETSHQRRLAIFEQLGPRRLLDFALTEVIHRPEDDRTRPDRRGGPPEQLAVQIAEWLRSAVGDSVLHQALASVDDEALEAGIAEYKEGKQDWAAGSYREAGRHFQRASSTWRLARLPLWPLASYWVGAATSYARDPAEARRIFRDVAVGPSPVYRAFSHWGLGVVAGTEGHWFRALAEYEQALTGLIGVHEDEGAVGVRTLLADAYEHTGRPGLALATLLEVIPEHRSRQAVDLLHNDLVLAGRSSLALGYRGAANAFYREARILADVRPDPRRQAEATLWLATVDADPARADSLLRAATLLVEQIPDSAMRARLHAEATLAKGATGLRSGRPDESRAALDSALAYYGQESIALQEARTLELRARANLAVYDTLSAITDLEALLAMGSAEEQRSGVDRFLRAMVRTHSSGAERRLRDLLLAQGRAGSLVSGLLPHDAPAPSEARLALIAGEELLALWLESADGLREVARYDAEAASQLGKDAGRFTRLLASGEYGAEPHTLGARLFTQLVAPALPYLEGVEELQVVAEGPLAGLPFEALTDSGGQVLARSFAISYKESRLRGLAGPRPGRREGTTAPYPTMLAVADPAYRAEAHPTLRRLRHARTEIDSLRAVTPDMVVLEGEDATAKAVAGELRTTSVFHFAGHVVIDPLDPRASGLVVPSSEHPTDLLSADALSRLDLSNLELVFLSACNTSRFVDGDILGFGPVSSGFLFAGVGAVIGTLWYVDDLVMSTVAHQFYRHLDELGSPIRALNALQRDMAASDDPRLSHPQAWAGLRVVVG